MAGRKHTMVDAIDPEMFSKLQSEAKKKAKAKKKTKKKKTRKTTTRVQY